MNSLVTRIGLVVMCAAASASYAWDGFGHMSVAYVAYQKLTPTARNKADALLRTNPDYPNWVKMMPSGSTPAQKNLMAFMIAATWPDRIKSAPGYHEDAADSQCGPASPQNIGFADTFRHRCWHFVDVAFTQDNSPLPATPDPNAEERLGVFKPVLGGNNDPLKAYDLSWTLHLVGDLHQPLHCTTRVRQGQPNGDAGGNLTKIKRTALSKSSALHGYWDDVLGNSKQVTKAIQSAKKLPAADAMKALDLNVDHWVQDGVQLAKTKVYATPIGKGGGPYKLTSKYKSNAKKLAQEQVSLGGERLANLLNAELK